ncbi:GIY-YIG nuclease family protein [Streptomyces sp. NPDC060334]|uniref:GIY-YIG nuclease family protein n=1 Tax=Streptomyces sp. NPDC060334 TaxID=3347099 RepID=UPI0036578DD5
MEDGSRKEKLRSARTAVYRLYDAETQLLYVGITMKLEQRLADHRRKKFWWHLVERQDVRWYDSRPEAEVVETEAIRTENPLYDGTDRIANWVHARQLRPVDPFWRPVAESLLALIEDGTCSVGSRLPPARELADSYKVLESSTGFALHMLRTARVIGPPPHNVVRPLLDHQPSDGQTPKSSTGLVTSRARALSLPDMYLGGASLPVWRDGLRSAFPPHGRVRIPCRSTLELLLEIRWDFRALKAVSWPFSGQDREIVSEGRGARWYRSVSQARTRPFAVPKITALMYLSQHQRWLGEVSDVGSEQGR